MTADVPVSLEVRDLTKAYAKGPDRVEVLRGISFDLGAGDALAITGPSGSGKSTLLHILGTLDEPSSGVLRIAGSEPFALPEPELARFRNRTIGFVFQDHHLLPQYSVLENVLIPTLAGGRGAGGRGAGGGRTGGGRTGSGRSGGGDRALELLERVGLSHRLDHRPAELSGGERQRVAVARALINAPTLLLCDEPTGSLDQATAGAVGDLLLELHGGGSDGGTQEGPESRTILIVVTHSLELAGRFDRRFELKEGRCVAP